MVRKRVQTYWLEPRLYLSLIYLQERDLAMRTVPPAAGPMPPRCHYFSSFFIGQFRQIHSILFQAHTPFVNRQVVHEDWQVQLQECAEVDVPTEAQGGGPGGGG